MAKFSHMSHGLGEHATGHAGRNIATDGSPKKVTPVNFHPNMSRKQIDTAGLGGQGHATATIDGGESIASSAAAAPIAHVYGGAPDLKIGRAVAPVPGHKSQTNQDCETHGDKVETGRDMLSEAVKN
jgi:hypothetical protein